MSDNRAIVEKYLRAFPAEVETLTALQHPEFVEEFPQSGERIRGSKNFRAIQQQYTDMRSELRNVVGTEDRWVMAPTLTPVRVFGSGDTFTALSHGTYPDGSTYHILTIVEMRDEKIYRATTFFAAPFEAPEWRAQWVERMEQQ
jgi:hypothetical protein